MYQGLGMFFGVFQSKSIRKNARVSVVFCRTVWYSDKKRKNAKVDEIFKNASKHW